MPTKLLKMSYGARVLREDALRPLTRVGAVGFTLDIGLNYYRGLPLSAIEQFELAVDGENVPESAILIELEEKIFTVDQARFAFSEFWAIKKDVRVRVDDRTLEPGVHEVALTLTLRNVYMRFAPGEWGLVDGSSFAELVLQGEKA